MRSILGIMLLLAGVGLATCQIEGHSAQVAPLEAADDWVRTADGWERTSSWTPALAGPPAVHPSVIAAGQLLVSMLALGVAAPCERTTLGE
jgi:hypothetical protein